MKTFSRPRLVVLVFALLALPALTCGVAPALRDLILRTQRVESYLAHVQLPPLLVDSAGNVVGPVLEYNRLFLYSSVDATWRFYDRDRGAAPDAGDQLITVLYTPSDGSSPLPLDASPNELLALEHGSPQWFHFETPDCTGTAWVWTSQGGYQTPYGSVLPRARVAEPGRTLYVEDMSSPPTSIVNGSHLTAVGFFEVPGHGEGRESQCFRHSVPQRTQPILRPLHPVADLDALFTPPFRLLAQGPMATP